MLNMAVHTSIVTNMLLPYLSQTFRLDLKLKSASEICWTENVDNFVQSYRNVGI